MDCMIKDLFKAVKVDCIIIKRLGFSLKDRNNMYDVCEDAKFMIREFDNEHGLSKDMKKFLFHRVHVAVMETMNR